MIPTTITEALIETLRSVGAKTVDGRKLDFPEYVPAPWAKMPDGSVLVAEERGEYLVAR